MEGRYAPAAQGADNLWKITTPLATGCACSAVSLH